MGESAVNAVINHVRSNSGIARIEDLRSLSAIHWNDELLIKIVSVLGNPALKVKADESATTGSTSANDSSIKDHDQRKGPGSALPPSMFKSPLLFWTAVIYTAGLAFWVEPYLVQHLAGLLGTVLHIDSNLAKAFIAGFGIFLGVIHLPTAKHQRWSTLAEMAIEITGASYLIFSGHPWGHIVMAAHVARHFAGNVLAVRQAIETRKTAEAIAKGAIELEKALETHQPIEMSARDVDQMLSNAAGPIELGGEPSTDNRVLATINKVGRENLAEVLPGIMKDTWEKEFGARPTDTQMDQALDRLTLYGENLTPTSEMLQTKLGQHNASLVILDPNDFNDPGGVQSAFKAMEAYVQAGAPEKNHLLRIVVRKLLETSRVELKAKELGLKVEIVEAPGLFENIGGFYQLIPDSLGVQAKALTAQSNSAPLVFIPKTLAALNIRDLLIAFTTNESLKNVVVSYFDIINQVMQSTPLRIASESAEQALKATELVLHSQ